MVIKNPIFLKQALCYMKQLLFVWLLHNLLTLVSPEAKIRKDWKMFPWNLNNYFDFHVCLSFRPPSAAVCACVRKLALIPSVVLQNVTNKSCLVCVKSEKYESLVTLRPQWDCCRRGEAEVRILNFKTTWSEFHHLPRVGPKQLCALAHLGCTRTAGTS